MNINDKNFMLIRRMIKEQGKEFNLGAEGQGEGEPQEQQGDLAGQVNAAMGGDAQNQMPDVDNSDELGEVPPQEDENVEELDITQLVDKISNVETKTGELESKVVSAIQNQFSEFQNYMQKSIENTEKQLAALKDFVNTELVKRMPTPEEKQKLLAATSPKSTSVEDFFKGGIAHTDQRNKHDEILNQLADKINSIYKVAVEKSDAQKASIVPFSDVMKTYDEWSVKNSF